MFGKFKQPLLVGAVRQSIARSDAAISGKLYELAAFKVLDLRANNLVGQISEIFIPEIRLRTICLLQNQLQGRLPRSLVYCKNSEVLDLSKSELEGGFPYWLESRLYLQVLVLRSNMFQGLVDSSRQSDHPFPELRIDLSVNGFFGPLPAKYPANLIAMKDENRSGLQYIGEGIINLSCKFFEGEIPKVIGDLTALKGLNFSHNSLPGTIPSSMGNLTSLDWLDLSSNKLSRDIPRVLADLTSLSFLNLSSNQLAGPIPQGLQFNTFENAFDRNPDLCERPLPKPCGNEAGQRQPSTDHEEEETESGSSIEWRAVLMGYGCRLAFRISAVYIMLETRRPRWLVRMVERKRLGRANRPKKDVAPRNHARYFFMTNFPD
ncbi:hypothetical protein CRG98_015550 [Punica granatum]|uniref:Uncharacterized protein n=1 Tax=Punica granatum TaxID=22663 RepID=A0A2I0K8R8_PUNGR|nr:hypothetical protein CRG98_015550 [Punica granatum]